MTPRVREERILDRGLKHYAKCLLYDLLTEAGQPSWTVSADVYDMIDEALKDWIEQFTPEPEPPAKPTPQWLLDSYREERFCFLGIGIVIGALIPIVLSQILEFLP